MYVILELTVSLGSSLVPRPPFGGGSGYKSIWNLAINVHVTVFGQTGAYNGTHLAMHQLLSAVNYCPMCACVKQLVQ